MSKLPARDRATTIVKMHLFGFGDDEPVDGARQLFAPKDGSTDTSYGFDSLDRVEMIMALEEEFARPISDDEAADPKFDTLHGVIAWAESVS